MVREMTQELYEKNKHIIQDHEKIGAVNSEFFFELEEGILTRSMIQAHLRHILSRTQNAFQIKVSLASFLQNAVSEELWFYYAHENEPLLDAPFLVSDNADVERLIAAIREKDLYENVHKAKPSSGWKLLRITTVPYSSKTNFLFGAGIELPDYIKRFKNILS